MRAGHWAAQVAPLAKKLRMNADLDLLSTVTPDAARSIVELLEEMSTDLDAIADVARQLSEATG